MSLRYGSLAVVALGLMACAQSSAPAATSAAPAMVGSVPMADWVARAAAAVRVTDEIEDTRDCEFVSILTMPRGWDGDLKGMTPAEQSVLYEMKVATVQVGGNLILLYPGPEPSGEAYLCTE